MKKKLLKLTVVAAVIAFTVLIHHMAISAEKEPIKIGYVGGLTGTFFLTQKHVVDGVNLAIKDVNNAGGILGRQVEMILRDDEAKVDMAVREFKDVILRKKVDFIIAGTNSAVGLAEAEIAKTYKTPFISIAANSNKITEEKGNRYTFLLRPNTRMEGNAIAMYVAKQGFKTIWTIAGDYEWGHTITDFTVSKIKQLVPGIKFLGESWPRVGETDFTPYINPILSAKPDFLLSFLVVGDLVNFTKQAIPYELHKKVKISGDYQLSLLMALGGEMPEDVIFWNNGEFFCFDTPEMNAFVEKYQKAYGGQYPIQWSSMGYEAVIAIKQAMEKVKSTNKEKVIDALEGMEFNGIRGKMNFRKCDHQGSGAEFVGLTVKNPKFPFCVMKNITRVPGEESWLSCEEIRKLRGGK